MAFTMEHAAIPDDEVQLSDSEQQFYLHFLIAKLEAPQNTHEALTAKAYESILACLQKDKKAQLP